MNKNAILELREKQLLETIHWQLSPEERQRLNYLRDRSEIEELTETEHQELLQYVDRIEKQGNDRLKAAIELAQIRQVDLDDILNPLTDSKSPNEED